MSLLSETYKTALLQTKRGNCRGVYSNAKPIYVLSLIDAIDEGCIIGNKITFDNEELVRLYSYNYNNPEHKEDMLRKSNMKTTAFYMPFFHLNAEPYYHIKWLDGTEIPKQALSPSAKFLREHVDYAYLDDGLWELLQDADTRQEFRQAIINHYLTSTE